VCPAALIYSDEDLLKTLLYDVEQLDMKVIQTYLDKDAKFLRK
jgi:hypothetical protein